MGAPYFEWDEEKARSNLRKHGVSFAVAARVFLDPLALTENDRVEGDELRWRTIGTVGGSILLVVAHTYGEADDEGEVIRIISARLAEARERRRYEEGPGGRAL